MGKKYTLSKVLNNNVLLATDSAKKEVVLVGKGIGYGQRIQGSEVSSDLIEKLFVPLEEGLNSKFLDMLNRVDSKLQETIAENIYHAQEILGELQPRLHLLLVDHIDFAIERLISGYSFSNPLLDDIRILYPDEYAIAQRTREEVNQMIDVELPESENGILALHYNAARMNQDVKDSLRKTNVIYELIQVVERKGKIVFKKDHEYKSLVLFLEAMIEGARQGIAPENPLLPEIRGKMKEAYLLAYAVAKRYESLTDRRFSSEDTGYLAIMLYRLFQTGIN